MGGQSIENRARPDFSRSGSPQRYHRFRWISLRAGRSELDSAHLQFPGPELDEWLPRCAMVKESFDFTSGSMRALDPLNVAVRENCASIALPM